jgi:hypothetical protein
VKSFEEIFILDASPSNSLSIMATAFRMSCFLYWHLKAWLIPTSIGCKWLRQFGGKKHNFSIFQSSGYLLDVQHIGQCRARFFCFGPYLVIHLLKKLLKSGQSFP